MVYGFGRLSAGSAGSMLWLVVEGGVEQASSDHQPGSKKGKVRRVGPASHNSCLGQSLKRSSNHPSSLYVQHLPAVPPRAGALRIDLPGTVIHSRAAVREGTREQS